ncbi:hypothetical protein NP233_g5919 [Leucocoprinus birnbaumii]|uniref:Uncharacterized protein n=1 Tax=Leucocoprinus birnbaumii TaxID=56174 RepID=A0AAD5YQH5_9AGAR|nr:hypothetical protein NP233_g5919 [Leucocoprinus birnbaumii]
MPGFFTSIFQWIAGLFFSKQAEIAVVGLQASGKTSFVNVITSGQVRTALPLCSEIMALTLGTLLRFPVQWSEDVVPTVAFNFRKIRKGNVTMKIWDVAGTPHLPILPSLVLFAYLATSLCCGQPRFRSMWERYCNGVDAIVFVVDSVDADKFNTARFELHQLLSQPTLTGVPLLVLGNKNDVDGHVSVKELIRSLYVSSTPSSLFEYSSAVVRQLDKISDRPVSCYSCSMKSQHNLDIVLQWLAGRSH